jgi:hypothetical protein
VGLRILGAATAASLLALATHAVAAALPPLVPTALVEDIKSAAADVAFMDYVGPGQVIKLAAGDVLVLSYLKSCEHETITGGTVVVGLQRSEVQGGEVIRAKVPCDGGKMRLNPQQANASAASAFRLQSADIEPTLYARTPLVQLPRSLAADERTLQIVRTDRRGERHIFKLDDAVVAAGFYDLANIKVNKTKVRLTRGAIYEASIGTRKVAFLVDAKAKSGPAPIVSRLLRFP